MLRMCALPLRVSGCVLLLILALLPATASWAAAAPGSAGPGAAGTSLTARAGAFQHRLLAGTRRLAAAQAGLRSALQQAQRAEQAQVAARTGLARATDGLNDFAAAAYRESGSELAMLLDLSERDPQDVLTAAGYLDRTGSSRAEVLTALRNAEAAAASARAAALQARRQAADTQRQVLKQVVDLQAAAATAAASLTRAGAASRSLRPTLPATDVASLAAVGYPNGLIPGSALCSAGIKDNVLRCDAAAGFRQLAAAYARAFRKPICVTDSYRSYPQQVAVYRERPSLAAVPGSSNHGWGLATDLCGGLQSAGTPQDKWMHAHAGRFGWGHPAWAEPGGSRPEPWHWEFIGHQPAHPAQVNS